VVLLPTPLLHPPLLHPPLLHPPLLAIPPKSWVLWLMPVIPATWEAEIRRITGQGPTPSQPFVRNCGAHLSSQATKEAEIRRMVVPSQPTGNKMRPHLQNNHRKMDRRCGNRTPALQSQSPEFKPQSQQKKKSSCKPPKFWDYRDTPPCLAHIHLCM
jgi:hypothetical protein